MKSKNNPRSRQDNIIIQEIKGEVLIYDLKENKAFCLNETSALVWQLCDGNKSVAEISQLISRQLKTPASEDLVWLAIDQLKRENLLFNSQNMETKFKGLSRREIVKKVGFASMVALPVISTLVAPLSAHAQSGCINRGGAAKGTPVTSTGTTGPNCITSLQDKCCSDRTSPTSFSCPTPGSCTCSGTCT